MVKVVRRSGFTLIELLVVFTLLALLLSIAVPRYLQYADGARLKARQQNIATLRDALDKFKSDRGVYPADLSELVERKYLREIPVDPVTETRNWVGVKDAVDQNQGISDVLAPANNTTDDQALESLTGTAAIRNVTVPVRPAPLTGTAP